MAESIGYVYSHLLSTRAHLGVSPISSAVIVPDPDPLSTKRKQSPTPDPVPSKRSRLSNEGSVESTATLRPSPPRESEHAPEATGGAPTEPRKDSLDRRKSSVQEERKRGQRLFGGLLSTLSQSASNGQQKRRQEIERRQLERAKQQKVEDEGRRAEKLARLNAVRKVEQVKFERESVSLSSSYVTADLLICLRCRCGYGIRICWLWQIAYVRRRNPN